VSWPEDVESTFFQTPFTAASCLLADTRDRGSECSLVSWRRGNAVGFGSHSSEALPDPKSGQLHAYSSVPSAQLCGSSRDPGGSL